MKERDRDERERQEKEEREMAVAMFLSQVSWCNALDDVFTMTDREAHVPRATAFALSPGRRQRIGSVISVAALRLCRTH